MESYLNCTAIRLEPDLRFGKIEGEQEGKAAHLRGISPFWLFSPRETVVLAFVHGGGLGLPVSAGARCLPAERRTGGVK